MDFTEYRQRGKEMIDYIADYLENIRDRRVFPDVKPGYMKNLLPDSAPIEGENWETIFSDVERVIMPGVTHWQSPHMHAYFPALNSFPSLLGDMLADAINCLGFTWASSPACTELEIIVMNWLGKMINLSDDFLHLNTSSRGGGVVQTTASEATLVCLLAGRTRAIQRFHEKRPGYQDAEINARLVAYCSDQAHSSVEKAALIGLVRMRYIEADENLSMRGQLLKEAIEDDIRQGLVPFWVCATLGTTGSCSFDNLEEIGSVCREHNLWLHVDAAYAGSAFICPEFRTWLAGIEKADSIAFNPSKWLMIHFDATALWVKDSTAVHRTFNVEPLYLQHENSGVAVDFMHWQIPLSRRFRALKIWFVLRSFGIKGLQRHIREGVRLAQKFEALVLADHRFEIPAKRHLGLVVFRIKGENEITERLLKRLNHRGNLHCIPSSLKGKYVIRFAVTSTRTTVDDILRDWMEIKNSATAILDEMNINISNRVYLKDTKEKCEGFGSSLLLSNSPLSPKIVNGSFAALFDADEFLAKTYAGIRIAHQESPSMRRRVRGILMSGKQFSLDSHMDVVVQTSMDSNTTNTRMIDCYGKTTGGNVKPKERDAICEDEESLEDCEMNWNLNTALQQLNSNNYLAVFNTQQLTPIDMIHHQNNLSFLSHYPNRYDLNNYTRSVNSVRTPLTQYQLYRIPKANTLEKHQHHRHHRKENQRERSNETSDLYPGKRFLNLDLCLYNVASFTDTIYNLPTPTEEIIPIIITEGTPPSSIKSLEEFEDLNKLRPPIPTAIEHLKTSNEKPIQKPAIPKKPAILTSYLNESLTKKITTVSTTTLYNTISITKTDFTLRDSKINTLTSIPENITTNLALTLSPNILNKKTTNTERISKETTNKIMNETADRKSIFLTTSSKTTNTDSLTTPFTTTTTSKANTTQPIVLSNETIATTSISNLSSKDVVLFNNLKLKSFFDHTSTNMDCDLDETTITNLNNTTTILHAALKEENLNTTTTTNTNTILNETTAKIVNPIENTDSVSSKTTATDAVVITPSRLLNETTAVFCKPHLTSSTSTTTTPLAITTNTQQSLSSEATNTSTNTNTVVLADLNTRLNSVLNDKIIKNITSKEDLMSFSSSLSDEVSEATCQPSSDSESSSSASLVL